MPVGSTADVVWGSQSSAGVVPARPHSQADVSLNVCGLQPVYVCWLLLASAQQSTGLPGRQHEVRDGVGGTGTL